MEQWFDVTVEDYLDLLTRYNTLKEQNEQLLTAYNILKEQNEQLRAGFKLRQKDIPDNEIINEIIIWDSEVGDALGVQTRDR